MHSFGMGESSVQLRVGAPNSARVAQPEEARRRERRQCGCEPCHEHQPSLSELRLGGPIFGLQALK